MIYDISKATAPAMPYLGKGTECIKLLLSQTSKDMREPLVPMLFPYLAHISATQNFSIPTSLGRKRAAWWPIWLAIRAVIVTESSSIQPEKADLPISMTQLGSQQAKSQISVSQLHFWGTTNHKTSPYYIYNYLIIKYIIYKRQRLW